MLQTKKSTPNGVKKIQFREDYRDYLAQKWPIASASSRSGRCSSSDAFY
jgi:hypothetical protein